MWEELSGLRAELEIRVPGSQGVSTLTCAAYRRHQLFRFNLELGVHQEIRKQKLVLFAFASNGLEQFLAYIAGTK